MKRFLYFVFLIIGVISIIDTICLIFYTPINFGTVLPGIIGFVFVTYAYLKLWVYGTKQIITNTAIKKLIITGIGLLTLSFILIESMIIYNSKSQENIQTDYVIILGAGLNGENASLCLIERLDKGISYLSQYPNAKAVVSGGQGFEEKISEAEAMKKYLIERGIDPKRILTEDKSTSTMENFRFSKKILSNKKDRDIDKIMIITSDFHMLRAKMLARRNGFESYGITSSTPISVRLNSYIREYFAIIKSFFIDR